MSKHIKSSTEILTKDELVRQAKILGVNIRKFETLSHSQLTYVFLHEPSGKLKIGVSYSPFMRAKRFGRLIAVIFNPKLEQMILAHFGRAEPPTDVFEKSTEWVEVSFRRVVEFVLRNDEDVFEIPIVQNIRKSFEKPEHPLYPSQVDKILKET